MPDGEAPMEVWGAQVPGGPGSPIERAARGTARWHLRIRHDSPELRDIERAVSDALWRTKGFAGRNSFYCDNPFFVERTGDSRTYAFGPKDLAKALLLQHTGAQVAGFFSQYLDMGSFQSVAFARAIKAADSFLHVLALRTPYDTVRVEPKDHFTLPYERQMGGSAYQLAPLNGTLDDLPVMRFIPSTYRSRTKYVRESARLGGAMRPDYASRAFPCSQPIKERDFPTVERALMACERVVVFRERDCRPPWIARTCDAFAAYMREAPPGLETPRPAA